MPDSSFTRNLLFHAYPRDNEMLRINLDYLARYVHLFNGKKIVNVAWGPGLLTLDQFRRLMQDRRIRTDEVVFISSESSPLGETEPFIDKLLPAVESLDRREMTFYCHTKGVSKADFEIPKIWAKLMWEHNLRDVREVERLLQSYPCCGILKKGRGTVDRLKVPWHFSGTFFWFNNHRLFVKKWRNIDAHRCGVEAYLSRHFRSEEAYCLKYDLKKEHGNTRLPRVWRAILQDDDYVD